ncbi:hypothetical protein SAMD00019534_075620 [Acytostelium subglobosum LB1]|uniref:hypothetical protein n=1 Tax=Acytostelium subglobosum LB1 TaxID=1410327 RepID=UPI00064506D9|nr:hypothetical protein SAMD00019534_075620 [Acytostelium subglobosum LB1]GAM24387.1 hypothetical protein SAMD00019534_075620 [Acytostelium subglobosum LB1]|eukprot:XP_012752713.1 hypothetical protein SAMD00019534_075620 [Acytostelium subglobosum LB1]
MKIVILLVVLLGMLSSTTLAATSCKVNGNAGTCQYTSDCSGESYPGFCPGSVDVECCIHLTSCSVNGIAGTCKDPSSCSGHSEGNYCTGSGECCIPESPSDVCYVFGEKGECKSSSSCTGHVVAGHCSGSSSNECCLEEAPGNDVNYTKVIEQARSRVAALWPYVWGGGHNPYAGPSIGTCDGYTGIIQPCPADSTVGLDCSGLVRDAFYYGAGIDYGDGGGTNQQEPSKYSHFITYEERQPGDVQFFGPRGDTYHVILYVGKIHGEDYMIEAEETGTTVHEVPLRTGGTWVRVY